MKPKMTKAKIDSVNKHAINFTRIAILAIVVLLIVWSTRIQLKAGNLMYQIPDYSSSSDISFKWGKSIYEDVYGYMYDVYFQEKTEDGESYVAYTIEKKNFLNSYLIYEVKTSDYMSSSEIANIISDMSNQYVETQQIDLDFFNIALTSIAVAFLLLAFSSTDKIKIDKFSFIEKIEDETDNTEKGENHENENREK